MKTNRQEIRPLMNLLGILAVLVHLQVCGLIDVTDSSMVAIRHQLLFEWLAFQERGASICRRSLHLFDVVGCRLLFLFCH